MKKVKNEIKRAFRLPGNAAVMTMMAVILVCAAPALVSIVDDSYNVVYDAETIILEKDLDWINNFVRTSIGGVSSTADFSYVAASVNGGVHIMTLEDPADITDVVFYRFADLDFSSLVGGASKISVVTESAPANIRFGALSGDNLSTLFSVSLVQSEVDPTVWSVDLNQIQMAQLRSGIVGSVFFDVYADTVYVDLGISTFEGVVLPYGEIIIGATGALLLVCAILATPWVSTSGLTVKRRR